MRWMRVMTSADTYDAQLTCAVPKTVNRLTSVADRSALGRELARWSARNSSKGAVLLESVNSLQFLAMGHSLAELQHAIQQQDLLGKRTWEARRRYWSLISWRYLTPPESRVVGALMALSCRGADDSIVRGALYFHFCLADRLTFDVATDFLPPLADDLLVYVCKFLSAEGKTAREILGALDFRLWGHTPQEVGARLAQLSQSGTLRFEWVGDIALLDLGEEPFDAYARRLGQEAR